MLALLVLTILILLVGQMVVTSAHNRSVSRNASAALQNEYGVLAGYRHALVRLEVDAKRSPDLDTLDDLWASPFVFNLGIAQVQGRVTDVERRFNLSGLVNAEGEVVPAARDQLVRLLQILGHEAAENAARIVDYVDADTQGDYEAGAKNAPFLNLQELQRVEGLKREVLFGDVQRRGLLPYVTVWPKGGAVRINPNTATVEVIQSLDADMTPELAQAIVSWRGSTAEDGKKKIFGKAEDLQAVPGMTSQLQAKIAGRLAFKAGAFEARIVSTAGGVVRKELYVVGRGAKSDSPLELLGAMREHDYFDLKPDEE
jgi:type II secretory pathway component PulK